MKDLAEAIFNSMRFGDIHAYIFDFGRINLNFYKGPDDCKTIGKYGVLFMAANCWELASTSTTKKPNIHLSPSLIQPASLKKSFFPPPKTGFATLSPIFTKRKTARSKCWSSTLITCRTPAFGRHSNIGDPPVIEHGLCDIIKKITSYPNKKAGIKYRLFY